MHHALYKNPYLSTYFLIYSFVFLVLFLVFFEGAVLVLILFVFKVVDATYSLSSLTCSSLFFSSHTIYMGVFSFNLSYKYLETPNMTSSEAISRVNNTTAERSQVKLSIYVSIPLNTLEFSGYFIYTRSTLLFEVKIPIKKK